MDDRNPSQSGRLHRRHAREEDGGGEAVACTGKSCQSCTAGAIADCVAVCCCPCAVVSFIVLAFFRLPWAVARRCLRKKRRRRVAEGRRERDGISENGEEENVNGELSGEEVWLDVYEIGHLGFGRVSFTGITFRIKPN